MGIDSYICCMVCKKYIYVGKNVYHIGDGDLEHMIPIYKELNGKCEKHLEYFFGGFVIHDKFLEFYNNHKDRTKHYLRHITSDDEIYHTKIKTEFKEL
jgi:hypothetical protein